jgi:hypothetical protein
MASAYNGTAAAALWSSRARTRLNSGENSDHRTDHPADESRPDGIVPTAQRAREEQRAKHHRGGPEQERAGPALEAARGEPSLRHDQHDCQHGQDQQERRALQERIIRVREVDLDVAGGERAGNEGRQERADSHCGGNADPLEDVEDEVHRAVP